MKNKVKLNVTDIQECIKVAKDIVKEESEPYKSLSFQVILGKLLQNNLQFSKENKTSTVNSQNSSQTSQTQDTDAIPDIESGKQELAKQCGISVQELDDVLYFKDNVVKVVATLSGNEPEKQIIAAKCVLTAYEIVFEQRWVKALVLSKCIDLSGIGQLSHLAKNLRKDKKSFILQGKKRGAEYKITGPGRASAFEIIKKLAKGETL